MVRNALQSTFRNKRLLKAIFAGGKTIVVSFARTLYALWLQVTGLIFAMFTIMSGSALYLQYRRDHFADHKRFLLTSAFCLVSLWFTLVSFRRANKTMKAKTR